MRRSTYFIRLCKNLECNLRFPAPDNSGIGVVCPKCKTKTEIIHILNLDEEVVKFAPFKPTSNRTVVLLDNVRSSFNVGSIIRTADAVGIKKIYLAGITPSPLNHKVLKTSLGSEKTIEFESHPNSLTLAARLKELGYSLISLEHTEYSQSLFEAHSFHYQSSVCLIVGNEIVGVDPDLLKISDQVLSIPMLGIKKSLNVATAFGIAVYSLLMNESFYNNVTMRQDHEKRI
jgi:23S rRNA (guanosine2251-2'-O)-methyltransferase